MFKEIFLRNGVAIATILVNLVAGFIHEFSDIKLTATQIAEINVALAPIIRAAQKYLERSSAKSATTGIPPAALVLVAVSALLWSSTASAEGLATIRLASKRVQIEHTQFDEKGEGDGTIFVETATVASLKTAPMFTLNLLVVDLEDRDAYRAGVEPGVCYGLHWSPLWYDGSGEDAFLSVGVCLEAGILNTGPDGDDAGQTAFAFTTLGVVQLLRWVNIGFGWQQRVALTNEGQDSGSPVFAFGVNLLTI